MCAAPIPMIIQSDHLQLHKDDEPPVIHWTAMHPVPLPH